MELGDHKPFHIKIIFIKKKKHLKKKKKQLLKVQGKLADHHHPYIPSN